MQGAKILRGAADLVLGARCAGCGRPGLGACTECAASVAACSPLLVHGLPDGLPDVYAAGAYAGVLRRLLLAAKERNALGLVPLLGDRLAAAVAAWALAGGSAGSLVLVPVPTARAQVVDRGLDLTAAIARVAGQRLRTAGLPVRCWTGLVLRRRPLDQSGLGRRDRLANLAGAFGTHGEPPAGRVVLVDDIVTTGATLREAARACADVSRPATAAATVAATARTGTRRGAR